MNQKSKIALAATGEVVGTFVPLPADWDLHPVYVGSDALRKLVSQPASNRPPLIFIDDIEVVKKATQ